MTSDRGPACRRLTPRSLGGPCRGLGAKAHFGGRLVWLLVDHAAVAPRSRAGPGDQRGGPGRSARAGLRATAGGTQRRLTSRSSPTSIPVAAGRLPKVSGRALGTYKSWPTAPAAGAPHGPPCQEPDTRREQADPATHAGAGFSSDDDLGRSPRPTGTCLGVLTCTLSPRRMPSSVRPLEAVVARHCTNARHG